MPASSFCDTVSIEPARADEELVGTGYRFVRAVARSAGAVVWEVEHVQLGVRQVMKLLAGSLADDARRLDRFRVEAQVMARLQHVNVLRVTDFGWSALGRPFLVSELLAGRTLAERLGEQGPLPVSQAVALGRQALAGLSAAHRAGLVHRELTLHNLFLCDDEAYAEAEPGGGRLKIMDFGVARVIVPAGAHPTVAPVFSTTQSLPVGASLAWSPELIAGRPADARTDLYGVGLVLYELIAGRAPFDGDDAVELAEAHARMVPARLSTAARQPVPALLDAIVARALAKDPAARFASADEMAAALLPFVAQPSGPAHPRPGSRDGGTRNLSSIQGLATLAAVEVRSGLAAMGERDEFDGSVLGRGTRGRRPAPASERAEDAVAAPARLAEGALVPSPDRAKIELNLPPEPPPAPEPEGPLSPEDVVTSEPFQRLPEARSRQAKTELRMPPKGAAPAPVARAAGFVEPGSAGGSQPPFSRASSERAAGAVPRTVGGRTERLRPGGPVSGEAAAPAAGAEPSRLDAAEALARTLGGRTERRLPSLDPAESVAAAAAALPHDPTTTGAPFHELLPSSHRPASADAWPPGDAAAVGGARSAAPVARSASPPRAGSGRTLVVLLGCLLGAGLLALAVLATYRRASDEPLEPTSAADRAADPATVSSEPRPAAADSAQRLPSDPRDVPASDAARESGPAPTATTEASGAPAPPPSATAPSRPARPGQSATPPAKSSGRSALPFVVEGD